MTELSVDELITLLRSSVEKSLGIQLKDSLIVISKNEGVMFDALENGVLGLVPDVAQLTTKHTSCK